MNRDDLIMDVVDSGYLQKYCSKFFRPWMEREEFEAELYLATVKASRIIHSRKRGMEDICVLVVEIRQERDDQTVQAEASPEKNLINFRLVIRSG